MIPQIISRPLIMATLLVAFVSCAQQEPTTNTTSDSSESRVPEAPFELLDAKVVGDSLVINVRYGGGCAEDHAFTLESNGPMMKSLPPKLPLRVVHRTAGDPCRALIVERHALDLKPWRGTPRGVTVILLENWKENLPYEYE
jgi:hypothetical protein